MFAEDLRVCVQNLIQDQYQTNQVWFMSVQKLAAKKKIPDQIILDIEDLDLEVGNEISDEDLQVGREIIPDYHILELEDLDLEVGKEYMEILEEDLQVENVLETSKFPRRQCLQIFPQKLPQKIIFPSRI